MKRDRFCHERFENYLLLKIYYRVIEKVNTLEYTIIASSCSSSSTFFSSF